MSGRSKIVLAAATAMMVAGAAYAAPPTSVFVAKAGASDLYERQSSQLVRASTHDRQLRHFADEMIRDHTKSTQMVKSAATRSGLRPKPPMLERRQRRMMTDLRHAHGRDRDHVYLDQQRQAHAEALGLLQDYALTGSAPALRRAAHNIVPVVQHHIAMLKSMH
jgi:putative membrane protein